MTFFHGGVGREGIIANRNKHSVRFSLREVKFSIQAALPTKLQEQRWYHKWVEIKSN